MENAPINIIYYGKAAGDYYLSFKILWRELTKASWLILLAKQMSNIMYDYNQLLIIKYLIYTIIDRFTIGLVILLLYILKINNMAKKGSFKRSFGLSIWTVGVPNTMEPLPNKNFMHLAASTLHLLS